MLTVGLAGAGRFVTIQFDGYMGCSNKGEQMMQQKLPNINCRNNFSQLI